MKMIARFVGTALITAGAVPLMQTIAFAQQTDRYDFGPHMMGWGGGWFGMIFGPIFMILVLAVVIAVAVLIVRWIGGPWQSSHGTHQPMRTPLDILKERYARGEIDKEEYEERRRVIGD
ncbi:SHOCT domain-containing protein [Hoeflea sp. TYP-13]|uniref:SHOCT domain-containing protein n=1 Tax=Hoeflea sp. TYP-13 TaxID=3230023 RepID=UPI0034C69FBF